MDLIFSANLFGAVSVDDDIISDAYEGTAATVKNVWTYDVAVGTLKLYQGIGYDPSVGNYIRE